MGICFERMAFEEHESFDQTGEFEQGCPEETKTWGGNLRLSLNLFCFGGLDLVDFFWLWLYQSSFEYWMLPKKRR